jgi:ParB family chromosome partitioning protein
MKNNKSKFSLKDEASNNIEAKMLEVRSEMGITSNIVKVSPNKISNWEYRDRREFEVGNIDELASSINKNGQAQPIVITKNSDIFKSSGDKTEYIVIAGFRRWLACRSLGIDVECVIKNIDFQSAVSLVIDENRKEDVSDYSKGMFFYKVLNSEKITQDQLSKNIGINITSLKAFLSFARVPSDVWDKVGTEYLKNVSSRSSLEISSICNKSKAHHQAILDISDKIAKGYGEKKIKKLVSDIVNNKADSITSSNFEYKFGKQGIIFSKSVMDSDKYIDFKMKVDFLFKEYFK